MGFEVVVEVVSERPQKGGDVAAGLSTLGENLSPPLPLLYAHLRSKAIASTLLLSSSPQWQGSEACASLKEPEQDPFQALSSQDGISSRRSSITRHQQLWALGSFARCAWPWRPDRCIRTCPSPQSTGRADRAQLVGKRVNPHSGLGQGPGRWWPSHWASQERQAG